MTEYKNYKLAFKPYIVKTIDEYSIHDIKNYLFDIVEEPKNIYFLTDDEKWFDIKYVKDLIYSVNIFLIVITSNKSFRIKKIVIIL